MHVRWEHAEKGLYCEVKLQRNKFDSWQVSLTRGHIGQGRGPSRIFPCDNYDSGLEIVDSITHRRKQNGYGLANLFFTSE